MGGILGKRDKELKIDLGASPHMAGNNITENCLDVSLNAHLVN